MSDPLFQCQQAAAQAGVVCEQFVCDPTCLSFIECAPFFGDFDDCCAQGLCYYDPNNSSPSSFTMSWPLILAAIIAISLLCCAVLVFVMCCGSVDGPVSVGPQFHLPVVRKEKTEISGKRPVRSRIKQMARSWLSDVTGSKVGSNYTEKGIGFDNDTTKLAAPGLSVFSQVQFQDARDPRI